MPQAANSRLSSNRPGTSSWRWEAKTEAAGQRCHEEPIGQVCGQHGKPTGPEPATSSNGYVAQVTFNSDSGL